MQARQSLGNIRGLWQDHLLRLQCTSWQIMKSPAAPLWESIIFKHTCFVLPKKKIHNCFWAMQRPAESVLFPYSPWHHHPRGKKMPLSWDNLNCQPSTQVASPSSQLSRHPSNSGQGSAMTVLRQSQAPELAHCHGCSTPTAELLVLTQNADWKACKAWSLRVPAWPWGARSWFPIPQPMGRRLHVSPVWLCDPAVRPCVHSRSRCSGQSEEGDAT